MQTKIRVAIHGREHGDPDLTFSDRHVDFVEQLVSRLHALAIQERAEAEAAEVVVQQPRHVSFRVDPPVVDEHIARGYGVLLPFDGFGAEDVAADVGDDGGG